MIKARENIETNIDWLGRVPGDWKVVKLKYALANIPYPIVDGPFGTQLKADEYTESGIPLVRISNLDYKGNLTLDDIRFISPDKALDLERSKIRLNDIIIGKTGATIGKSGLNDKIEYGIVSSSCLKVSVDESILSPRFFRYYVTSFNFQSVILQTASGSTRDTINITPMANLEVVLPSVMEQLKIVKYLDHQTGIIDQLISQKEKLIDLLKEKRQAVINEVVTGKTIWNRTAWTEPVEVKDSGIEWLGEVPEHWKIKRLKFISSTISKGTTPSTEGKGLVDNGIRFLKAENIKDSVVSSSPEFYIDDETHELLRRSQLEENDILFVIAGATIGKVAILPKDLIPANTNQAVCFIRLKKNENHRFVHYWLLSSKIYDQVWLKAVQSAQPNLSMENLGNFPIPYPDATEQADIVDFINKKNAEFSELLNNNIIAVEKLKEYRQAIISEAVTGKIDVRDWEPTK